MEGIDGMRRGRKLRENSNRIEWRIFEIGGMVEGKWNEKELKRISKDELEIEKKMNGRKIEKEEIECFMMGESDYKKEKIGRSVIIGNEGNLIKGKNLWRGGEMIKKVEWWKKRNENKNEGSEKGEKSEWKKEGRKLKNVRWKEKKEKDERGIVKRIEIVRKKLINKIK